MNLYHPTSSPFKGCWIVNSSWVTCQGDKPEFDTESWAKDIVVWAYCNTGPSVGDYYMEEYYPQGDRSKRDIRFWRVVSKEYMQLSERYDHDQFFCRVEPILEDGSGIEHSRITKRNTHVPLPMARNWKKVIPSKWDMVRRW